MNSVLKMSMRRNCLELLARYKAERDQLDEKIAAVQSDIDALDADDGTVDTATRQRKARGLNRRIIRTFFHDNPDAVLTAKEIGKKTGIPTTSAVRALRQLAAKGVVEQTEDNQWRKKDASKDEASDR